MLTEQQEKKNPEVRKCFKRLVDISNDDYFINFFFTQIVLSTHCCWKIRIECAKLYIKWKILQSPTNLNKVNNYIDELTQKAHFSLK